MAADGDQQKLPATASKEDLAEYLDFALRVVQTGGDETLRWFRKGHAVENKRHEGQFDPVTDADRACEQSVRQAIQETYPEHGIVGEEFGESTSRCGLTWVIDPIDGTRAFVSGMVHWGVLLALSDGNRPLLGVLYQPFTRELFWGTNSSAYYRRDGVASNLSVRKSVDLPNAILASTSPDLFQSSAETRAFEAISDRVMLTRYGGDCYHYAMLAIGCVDIVIESQLARYDIEAIIPIVRGAGGTITDWSGNHVDVAGRVVACASERLHTDVLRILQAHGPFIE